MYVLEKNGVGKFIADGLKWNLNKWPRLEARKRADKCDEWFYEHLFTKNTLEKLSQLTGLKYAAWGDKVDDKYYVGIKQKDDGGLVYAPVGLRWTASAEDWKRANTSGSRSGPFSLHDDGDGALAKRTRHVYDNLWRPQIVCTIRPLELYYRWRSYRFTVPGGRQGRRRFNIAMILQTKEWRTGSFEIVPLCFYLRVVGRADFQPNGTIEHNYRSRSNGLALRDMPNHSRHLHDDEIYLNDPDFSVKLAEDWETIGNMQNYLRNLHQKFEAKHGYGEW